MHFVISLVWLGCVAAMAHQMRLWLKNPKIKGWINRTLGVALCGFGLLLASETYRE
jgi:threonine/homoserine/homoserine lactone efflux protein